MEKKSIFETNVRDEIFCELENLINETQETGANRNDEEVLFEPESNEEEQCCWDINDEEDFEEELYYYDDNEYTLEDTWDAMTDGMYGDMPEGWDGDLEFLGY